MDDSAAKVILVADDTRTSRMILRKIFSDQYEILEAENGREAVDILLKRGDISAVILDIVMPELDGFGVLSFMREHPALHEIPVVVMTASTDDDIQMKALDSGAMDVLYKPINSAVTKKRVENLLMSMDSVRLAERNRNMERELREADTDVISGIYNKNAFLRHTAQYLAAHPEGDYILARWDIDNFKIYNDIYGTEAGNRFLHRIGDYYREHSSEMPGLIYYAHYEADHFVCFFSAAGFDPESIYDGFASYVSGLRDRPFDISPRIGLYRVDDPKLDVAIMCDRAYLALQSIKKSYGKRSAWYENSMRDAILFEHDIVNQMKPAL